MSSQAADSGPKPVIPADLFWYPPHVMGWRVEAATGFVLPTLIPLQRPRFVGKLKVHVHRARELHDTSFVGQMDPCIEIRVGDAKRRTKVHKRGGVSPLFDETFEFDLTGDENVIRVKALAVRMLHTADIGECRIPLNHALQIHTLSAHSVARDTKARSPALRSRRHTQHFRSLSGAVPNVITTRSVAFSSADMAPPPAQLMGRKKSQDDSALLLSDASEAAAAHAYDTGKRGSKPPRFSMFSGHPRTPVAPTTPKSESRHVASSTSVTPDVVGQAHRLGDIQAQGHSQSQHQRDQSTDSDTGKLSSTLAAHASAQTEQSKQGLQQLLDTVAAAESVPEHTRNVITALLKQEQFRLEHQERHQSQANGAGADSNSSSAGNATAAMTSNVSVPTSTAWFDMVRDNHVPAGQVLLGFEYIPAPRQSRSLGSVPRDVVMELAPELSVGSQRGGDKLDDERIRAAATAPRMRHGVVQQELLIDDLPTRVFGVPLQRASDLNDGDVPRVMVESIEYLSQPGRLDAVGLFRIEAKADEVARLKEAYDHDQDTEFTSVEAAASLLKLFIRELKPPIVPYNSYLDFILVEDNEALQADNKAKCARYQELILRLPTVNRDALRYLLDFLSRVASHSATNKMDVQNLAIVFAPNIFRRDIDETRRKSVFMKMELSINALQSLIDGFHEIFSNIPYSQAVVPAAAPPVAAAAVAPASSPSPSPEPTLDSPTAAPTTHSNAPSTTVQLSPRSVSPVASDHALAAPNASNSDHAAPPKRLSPRAISPQLLARTLPAPATSGGAGAPAADAKARNSSRQPSFDPSSIAERSLNDRSESADLLIAAGSHSLRLAWARKGTSFAEANESVSRLRSSMQRSKSQSRPTSSGSKKGSVSYAALSRTTSKY